MVVGRYSGVGGWGGEVWGPSMLTGVWDIDRPFELHVWALCLHWADKR